MEYTNTRGRTYYLHINQINLNNNAGQFASYYFARARNPEKAATAWPEGYEIVESGRNGLPCLRKIQAAPANPAPAPAQSPADIPF